MTNGRPEFRVIDANASDDEVAAIVAALTLLTPAAPAAATGAQALSMWVAAPRLASRRSGLSRGDWRMSGRIGRRARA